MSFGDSVGMGSHDEVRWHKVLMDSVDEGDADAPPKAKAKRANKTSKADPRKRLITRGEISQEHLAELLDPGLPYAKWLRVVLLRLLIKTPALGRLKGRMSFNLNQVCSFLGFENFEEYAESNSLQKMHEDLKLILVHWENELPAQSGFPDALQENLDALSQVIGLSPLESRILGLGVLIHAESMLDNCVELIGSELPGHNIERILAPMLGEPMAEVAKCLERQERLSSSGLLSIDLTGRYGLRQLIDFLTASFPSRMLVKQQDPRKIVEGFVRPSPKSTLAWCDFEHIGMNGQISQALLSSAVSQKSIGVNILIYGKPGTGKTEFARLLAQDLGLMPMEIANSNISGSPVAPIRRFRNQRIAQAFLRNDPSVIIFDECEEVLNPAGADRSDDEAISPRKSWINQIFETNEVPTIWIANSVNQFDEAYLRRFSLCFEMPVPSQRQREKMIETTLGELVNPVTRKNLAQNSSITPALLNQTARVVHVLAQSNPELKSDELATHWLNNTLTAQKFARIKPSVGPTIASGGFDPAWVNCALDLDAVRRSIVESKSARLCLYGPPGTGKTAFGKWIAREMDAPHLVLKASDILSPFLGETEQKIARAFDEARQQNAVLQFDEVDSFLQSRKNASKQWELTQVNEMLTQMESFNGVFLASTNLFEHLDEASLRRFDLALKFDYLKPDAALGMFEKTCHILGLGEVQKLTKVRLNRLGTLTPGDFEQAIRRAKLAPAKCPIELLQQLESALALKKSGVTGAIGFLAAA